jgi:hypothetical protein
LSQKRIFVANQFTEHADAYSDSRLSAHLPQCSKRHDYRVISGGTTIRLRSGADDAVTWRLPQFELFKVFVTDKVPHGIIKITLRFLRDGFHASRG